MAATDQPARRARPGAASGNGHRPLDADAGRGQETAADVQGPGRSNNGAGRDDDQPQATRGISADSLGATLKAIEQASWATLKELRAGRKYRKNNPPPAEPIADLGHCEACGQWRSSFDDLVHHQFHAHPEIFLEPGELPLEAPPCLCRSCNPGAYLEWIRTPEARGAKT